MRLIDAVKLQEKLNEYYNPDTTKPYGGMSVDAVAAMSAIDNAPTVCAEPVKHAHWEPAERDGCISYADHYRQCSVCKGKECFWGGKNYCSNCGAKMDK